MAIQELAFINEEGRPVRYLADLTEIDKTNWSEDRIAYEKELTKLGCEEPHWEQVSLNGKGTVRERTKRAIIKSTTLAAIVRKQAFKDGLEEKEVFDPID